MDRIDFDPEELDVATEWHGGQSSMLYAIASTGALSRGSERFRPHVDCSCNHGWETPSEPCRKCRGAKMTDAQWLAYLAGKLESEAEECAEEARTRAKRSPRYDEDEPGEMSEHADALDGIAAKCRAAIAALTGGTS